MASRSATSSRGSSARYVCDCGLRARMYTSCSLKNPGRRFYTCNQNSDIQCDYFEWYDGGFDGRHGEVITHLNSRRVYLEAKIELLEEKIVQLEAELATKKEKKVARKKQLQKLMKFGFFAIVLLMAVMVIKMQRTVNVNEWKYIM
ncbi:GRF-type domain-containing protein [Heracleum sosnowskyi]|uniref:GRF-type domain-containing protein n=1 Tax=Heracleum sosnowskyi TaxID=360622 RepID=A0AAD8N822_9APIA|nr:GRF-type domain-containing protein [Heracleum sosnowskyi]